MHNPTYRVILILQTVASQKDGFTLSELTRRTDIPVGTISPILKTLVEYKMLEIDKSTNRYTIGIQSFFLGASFTSKNSVLDLIRLEMEELSGECMETSQLGILKEGDVFYLLKAESQEPIRLVSEVGGSLPAYATAIGKVVLSGYNSREIDQLYGGRLQALTEKTITDMQELNRQLEEIRRTGFAYEQGESGKHTSCIAVPIYQNRQLVAGLSVVFPIFRKSREKTEAIQMSLVKHKKNIEKILMNTKLL